MRRAVGIVIGVVAVGLVGVAVWLGVRAFRLSTRSGLSASDEAATLQALGGAAALIATIVLLGVTGWYASVTASMLRQSGPVVAAVLRAAWIHPSGAGALTGPFSKLGGQPADPAFVVPMIAIALTNSGNAAVEVQRVQVASDKEFSYSHTTAPVGQSCPFMLGAHSSVTCYLDAEDFRAAAMAWEQVMKQPTRRARAVVELGSGLSVKSAWANTPYSPDPPALARGRSRQNRHRARSTVPQRPRRSSL